MIAYLSLRDRLARATRDVRETINATPGLTENQKMAAYLHTLTSFCWELDDVVADIDDILRQRERETGAEILPPPASVFEDDLNRTLATVHADCAEPVAPESFDPLQIIIEEPPTEEPEPDDGALPTICAVAQMIADDDGFGNPR